MRSRRSFLEQSLLSTLALIYATPMDSLVKIRDATNQVNWDEVRMHYPVIHWEKIYLNSGSAGIVPVEVLDRHLDLIRYLSSKAPYEVWEEWQPIKKQNLSRLGELVHASPEELQVVRNTTEALNMIISGLPIGRGDEVVIADCDYPFAVNSWENRATRDGLSIKKLDIQLPLSDDEVIEKYKQAITDRTRVIHITHVTHREGHIMPVQKMCEIAHQYNIEVVVDGAHAVAHIPVDLNQLDCDYYASSLHKWLTAPLGTGLIFVKRDKIDHLQSYLSSYRESIGSIDQFEQIGTRMWASEMTVGAALDFLDQITMDEKVKRLQYLKQYWTGQLKSTEKVSFQTILNHMHSGAISTFKIDGYNGKQILNILNDEFHIHAKSVDSTWGSGVRISPNLFTSEKELDHLVNAIKEIATRN